MSTHKQPIQVLTIVVMIGVVIGLHYTTPPEMRYQHAVYRMLFYLPLVIGSFWFGLKGALGVSGTVAGLYLFYLIGQRKGFSYDIFDKLLEIIVYLAVALRIAQDSASWFIEKLPKDTAPIYSLNLPRRDPFISRSAYRKEILSVRPLHNEFENQKSEIPSIC